MTFMPSREWLVEVAKGAIAKHSIVQKFGRNPSIGTTFAPVTRGGHYRTPQPAAATTLRVKAGGNANDTAAGSGAQELTLVGLNASGVEITETLATAGASASSATSNSFIRLYRCYVSASGTYATESAGSHSGDLTIENGAGGTDWALIGSADFPRAQTEIAAYSIQTGYTGYVISAVIYSDTSKTTDVILFQRGGILRAAAPYAGMRALHSVQVYGGTSEILFRSAIKIDAESDIGWMAKVNTGTASVGVNFGILLVQN